ncbi:hypothetical protein FQZ97_889650 [compost metagenome]
MTEQQQQQKKRLDDDICVHIFAASAAMVGVCITVIGIFQVVVALKREDIVGDDLLAINAVIYLTTAILSYWGLRTRKLNRNHLLEQISDALFLIGLAFTTVVAVLIAWTITLE